MSRALTPGTSLDSLKKEAKQWLKALRAHDAAARARLRDVWPQAPSEPVLRDVQHAIALEHGLRGWSHLTTAIATARRPDAAAQQVPDATDAADASAARDARMQAVPALLEAAGRGHVAQVIALLDAHPDLVNERGTLPGNTGLRTALHFGVGHEAVVRALLSRGADPNIRDEGDAAMPLHFAAENQDLAVIRLLIAHGADPIGAGDYHELTVIGWAACWDYREARPDVVSFLLAHGAQHTMCSAVAMGDVASIRAIASRSRADLDARMDRTNRRRRPLHLAVIKRQPASLAALIDLGADLEALDEAGLAPLDQAALGGQLDMARLLIDRGAAIRLPAAVALQRTADIERLMREDPDCLKPGYRWGRLIVRASEYASGDVIELLIRHGASVDAWDDPTTAVDAAARFTPLHAAASRGNAAAAQVLLAHGADASAREEKYCGTPAGWAAHFGFTAVRDVILAGRIDLFDALAFDLTDRIPEILARDPEAIDRPFRAYATGEPRPGQWWPEPWHTPLAWAVVTNRAEAARVLLDRGAARPDAPDGRTLEDLAREPGREEVAEVLRARGA